MTPARDRYPAGVPCWVDTLQPDPQAAVEFYGGLFGWELSERMPPDVPGHYFVAQVDGLDVAAISSQPDGGAADATWVTYVAVESADATAAEVIAAGGAVLVEPFDVLEAGRTALVADPAGASFCLWQAGRHVGARLVNAANTWNWSDLNTDDPEGAAAFYGRLFGWRAHTVDMGDAGSFTMLQLPGYGDFLAEMEPEVRERQASEGAPEGFADTVAGLGASEGAPAHWSVTFTVDDPDAAAARAAELGGAVTVPPFDAGPVRMAMLVDPQGAPFAVNRYDPTAAG